MGTLAAVRPRDIGMSGSQLCAEAILILDVEGSYLSGAQSSRLAEFGGRGMSFNICRGTLGSLAMFNSTRNACRA
jgi:hypothetical protein